MRSSSFVVAVPLLLLAVLPAQEGSRAVGSGRAFTEQKVLTPGQRDRWEVDVAADEVLRFRVTAQQFDPVLELVDAAGTVLASDDVVGSQSYVQHRGQGRVRRARLPRRRRRPLRRLDGALPDRRRGRR